MAKIVNEEKIQQFKQYLLDSGKKVETVDKYIRDICKLQKYLDGSPVTHESVEGYIAWLEQSGYKLRSINSFIIVMDTFFKFFGWDEYCISAFPLNENTNDVQKKFLTTREYNRLLVKAVEKGNYRLAMLIQMLASVDIRLTELSYVTVEAVKSGKIEVIRNKRPYCCVLPPLLSEELLKYAQYASIESGIIFCTANGAVWDRTAIWRNIRDLCKEANVDASKVTIKNLGRRLIQNYYQIDYPDDLDNVDKEEMKERLITTLEKRIHEYEIIIDKLSNTIEAYRQEIESVRQM